jgi:hypothetical protein
MFSTREFVTTHVSCPLFPSVETSQIPPCKKPSHAWGNIAVEGIGTYIYEQIKDSYSEAKIQIYRVSCRLGQTCALSIFLRRSYICWNNTMERHAVLVLENQSVWKTTGIAGCVWTPLHIFCRCPGACSWGCCSIWNENEWAQTKLILVMCHTIVRSGTSELSSYLCSLTIWKSIMLLRSTVEHDDYSLSIINKVSVK